MPNVLLGVRSGEGLQPWDILRVYLAVLANTMTEARCHFSAVIRGLELRQQRSTRPAAPVHILTKMCLIGTADGLILYSRNLEGLGFKDGAYSPYGIAVPHHSCSVLDIKTGMLHTINSGPAPSPL
jgi:hypothetical protein